MIKRKVHFTLDCSKPGSQFTVEGLHVGDKRSCELHILLRNGIIPLIFDDENIAVIMNAQKPDGTTISALCDVSADKKEALYTLDEQDTAVAGIVGYELIVAGYDGENYRILYSATFSAVVSAGVIVPVFKKLETQPEDWATDYKKYFRKTANGYEKITDNTCPAFNSDDFYFLINPNYDSENDYAAFEKTVANVQNLIARMNTVETDKADKTYVDSQNAAQNSAIEGKASKVGIGSTDELMSSTSNGDIKRSGYRVTNNSDAIKNTESMAKYIPTARAVGEVVDGIQNQIESKADKSKIPDISGKADKATTLAGYGITDAYTKDESDLKFFEFLDGTFTGDPNFSPTLLVNNTVDQTYNPNGHYILYYVDSDGGRHNLFDFTYLPFLTQHQDISGKFDKSKIVKRAREQGELAEDTVFSTQATSDYVSNLFSTYNLEVIDLIKIWGDCVFADSQYASFVYQMFKIDNTVDQTYNPNGHYILYYIDSDNVRHNLFDFSNYFAEKAAVPSKTSQLTNDSGFLTSHQSLANYYNKTEVNSLLGGKANASHTHSQYLTSADIANKADKSEIPDISGKADKATTLAGYGITDAYTKDESDVKFFEFLDAALSGDPTNVPTLLIDKTVNQTYNPNGHYMLYYIDSDFGRHNLFDLSQYFADKSDLRNQMLTLTEVRASYAGASGETPRYKPGKWLVETGTAPIEGNIYTIKLPGTVVTSGVYLSVHGTSDSDYFPIVINGTSRLTTQFAEGIVITVIYEANKTATVYELESTTKNNTTYTYTGNVFRVLNYYDSGNTNTLLRTYALSSNKEFPLIGASTATGGTPASHTSSYKDIYGMIPSAAANKATINLSTGKITAPGGIVGNLTGTASAAPWTGITGKPTTLSGYGITDAYTKAEVNAAIQAAIGGVENGSY